MDPADELRGAVVLGLELIGAAQPERACDRGPLVAVGREVVRLQVADDLESVLQPAEEPIRVGQRVGIVLGDVALLGQRREGAERVGLAEAFVTAAVHDLQELHRELDVPDPPRPRFTSVSSLPRRRMYSSRRTLDRRTSWIASACSSWG